MEARIKMVVILFTKDGKKDTKMERETSYFTY